MNDDLLVVVRDNVRVALAEDLGDGDLTAALVPADLQIAAHVLTRENAILCGCRWFDEVFSQLDNSIAVTWRAGDGDAVTENNRLCEILGPARAILTGERTALNFLQTLSATATLAQGYADAVAGTTATVLDTRKTIPGLRQAQKYAVRCGGCQNHRMGLYDGILIKENHIRSAGSIASAVKTARSQGASVPVEVEIERLDQLGVALDAGADIVMLDNFDFETMTAAVVQNRQHSRPARLEASGNVSLETIREIAETGVDFISVGGLTKHVRAIDLSMQFLVE